jgi:outer membrane protein
VSFGTSINQGTSTRWSLSAKQALYNPERDAQKAQLEKTAEMAELRADSAQQTLMLETVQRYLDVVLAERKLAVLQLQYSAVSRALTEAQDRFAIGDMPVTDTHEAAARASGLQAQVLAADSDLHMARVVLSESTGLSSVALKVMRPQAQASQDTVQELLTVLAQAQDNNLSLRIQQAALSMAQQEVRKHSLRASATLDAVATVGHERLSGSGDFGNAANTQSQQMIGLSLNIPLYTGGWREGKLQESLSAQDKASAELELMRVQVGQQTRRAWLTLHSGQAQISAHMEAVKAHRARLDATRLGRQVGDRTTQELLNAENDAANAELAQLAAQTQRLYLSLTLEALTGSLSVQSLARVNAQLAP